MLDAGCWMLGPFVVQASRLHDSTTVEEVQAGCHWERKRSGNPG
jgi:hypothetical protein